EGMARSERLAVAAHDVGVLVLLEPDPMTGAVHEPLAIAAVADELAGYTVDVLARRAHHRRGNGRRLRLLEHAVQLPNLGGWLATGPHAPGDVGAVAVRHGAAEVAQDHLVGVDDPAAGVVMGAGSVLAGRDDGEVDLGVAFGDQPATDVL